MKQRSEHLSSAQIEEYGSQSSGAGPETEAWIESHLADCPSCRRRVLDFQRAHFALLAAPKVNTFPTLDCPSEDDLRDLAAGLCPEALADKLSAHAATCDRCGPLLREYKEDFSDDFTPEEQAILNNLQSASAEWQKKTARQMLEVRVLETAGVNAADASAAEGESSRAATTVKSDVKSAGRKVSTTPARKIFSWKWVLVPAAAAIVALAAFSIWYTQRDTPEKVEKLLAQAYTEDRNLEMRFPYAKYSDFRQERGEQGSFLKLPDSYREAGDQIAANLKKHPDDPTWLLLSARFDLLHWDYKSAFSTLERIDDLKVNQSSEARLTRALALYEKAEAENQQSDQLYAEIVELMGKTLQKNPDDLDALFNQAIACEKSHMYECAIGDYKHLLDVEKDRGWAGEAQKNLGRIEEKKKTGP